jgi:protoheme IX farnesyltransferase
MRYKDDYRAAGVPMLPVVATEQAVTKQIVIYTWLTVLATLALVLFLWTPPHFWSLAIANCTEYRAAGVPMLPVVVGVERAARTVLASTIALVAASLLPAAFGAGPLYLAGATAGGAIFVVRSWRLARAPSRATAMAAFFASLVQLTFVLAGATLDALLR